MAPKKPSFAGLAVAIPVPSPAASAAPATPLASPAKPKPAKVPARGRGRPPVEATLRERAAQLTMYVNPEFSWALKGYAVEARMKPHDCLLEALEHWAKRKHIAVPVRVTADPVAPASQDEE